MNHPLLAVVDVLLAAFAIHTAWLPHSFGPDTSRLRKFSARVADAVLLACGFYDVLCAFIHLARVGP